MRGGKRAGAGRPTGTTRPENRKDEKFEVRCSAEMMKQIKRAAKKLRISQSSFTLAAIREKLERLDHNKSLEASLTRRDDLM